MTRLNDGEMISFEAVYRAHGKDIYKFLFRLSGSQHDAEDLLQETFLSVMNKLPTFKGDSSLKTWIYSIAINKFRDSCRHAKIRNPGHQHEVEQAAPHNQLDELVASETKDRVKHAFYSLPEEQRTAFALVRFEGMAYKEAAQAIGTTLDTIRMRVHRAHKMLAEQLKDR